MVVLAVVVVMVRVVGRVVVLVVMVVVSMYTITEEDVSVDGEKLESLFQKCLRGKFVLVLLKKYRSQPDVYYSCTNQFKRR